MRSLAIAGSVDFSDSSYLKALQRQAHRPQDGAGLYPAAVGSATMQWNYRQLPTRGMFELLRSYRNDPWLHVCLDIIGRKFGEVPWKLFSRPDAKQPGKRLPMGKFKTYRGRFRHKAISKAVDTGELQEIEDHPLLTLWENPCPVMSGVGFRDMVAKYLKTQGEAFALKRRDTFGIVYELWPIPPTWIVRAPAGNIDQTFELVVPYGIGAASVQIDDMLWLKYPDLINPYGRGAGQGESLGSYLDTNHYAMDFQKAYFYNDARPNMFIHLPGADENAVEDFKQHMDNSLRGATRSHRPLIYEGPNPLSIQEIDVSKGMDSALPLLDHNRDTLLSSFGIPPELAGVIENSNRATIGASETIMARNVTAPLCEFVCDEINRDLVQEFDQGEGKILFTYDNPVPEDDEQAIEVCSKMPWIASGNELRKLAGLPDIGEDGEYYMVPNLYTATDDPATPIEKPQPAVMGVGFGGTQPPHQPNTPGADAGAGQEPDTKKKPSEWLSKADNRTKRVIGAVDPEELQNELDPLWQAKVDEWGNDAYTDMGLKPAFNVYNANVRKHLEDFSSDRITKINDTTRDAIAAALGQGVAAGEGAEDLARRIQHVFDEASSSRALMIARTEVTRSANFATLAGYKQTGLVDRKKWIATQDDKTRDEHAELGEQPPIDIDDDFEVGGYTGQAPGDFGDPEMDINCRCTIAPVAPEVPGDDDLRDEDREALYADDDENKSQRGISKGMRRMSDAQRWKRFDVNATTWENQAKAAVKKAFDAQCKRALQALK